MATYPLAKILFTDESRYTLSNADGRIRVWRHRHERCSDCCVLQADRWGGGSLTVWGGFIFNHRTQCHIFRQRVNAALYQNDVMNNHVVPFFAAHPNVRLLQQTISGLTRPV